jgi:hypothetical protein
VYYPGFYILTGLGIPDKISINHSSVCRSCQCRNKFNQVTGVITILLGGMKADLCVLSNLEQLFQLINSNTGFLYNTIKSTFLNFFVVRYYYRNVFFKVMHKDMTAFLVIHYITNTTQSLYNLVARKCFTQMRTSTSLTVA